MIKGHCHTNLDDYKREHWPDQFVSVPRIGDKVQAESGKILEVVGITHIMVKEGFDYGDNFAEIVPCVKVELNRGF
jgi:hypothetical protein